MSDDLKIDDGAARDDAVASPPKGHQRLGLALVLISIAQLMVVLDATIANIALPFIGQDLDISGPNLTWIVTGYSLVFGGLLLLGGRLADLYGRRRIFMIGLVVFAVASLLGGLAQSELLLLSARGLQGFGAALASPAALALITTTFPAGPARNRAFAIYAAMSGAGAAVGLILGGWLTGTDFSLFGARHPRLADDLPHQRADRHRDRHARAALPARVRHPPGPPRHPGRHHRHRRPARARLRSHARRQPQLRLVRPVDHHDPGRRSGAARALHRGRVPRRAPAAAVPDLRQPDTSRELRGDGAAAGRDVRDVLLPQPVHPERDGLQPAEDRRRVPPVQRGHRAQRGRRVQPGRPDRRPLHRRRRHADRVGRAVRVLAAQPSRTSTPTSSRRS